MQPLTEILKTKIPPGLFEVFINCDQNGEKVIETTINRMYAAIPDQKRISYGIVFTVKTLVNDIYQHMSRQNIPVLTLSAKWFDRAVGYQTKCMCLGLLSLAGLENPAEVFPCFQRAAAAEHFEIREMAQMFFRKLIKKCPRQSRQFLQSCARNQNPNVRRFAAESLRPVVENNWLYEQPEFSLKVLRLLFREPNPYPRASVGNNLSDLARRCPELVFDLVKELVQSGDKNSRWIAYRACRNLVKTDPQRVMDIFDIDEYKYKNRIYKR